MDLPKFAAELERYKEEIGQTQFWRYTKGNKRPRLITWLVERPELIEALAADARALAGPAGRQAEGKTECTR